MFILQSFNPGTVFVPDLRTELRQGIGDVMKMMESSSMYFRTIMDEDGFSITNTWMINFKFNSVQCLIHKLWNSVERSCLDYNTNVCTITVIGRNSIILFAYWKYSFMAIFFNRFKLIINVAYNTLLFFNGIYGIIEPQNFISDSKSKWYLIIWLVWKHLNMTCLFVEINNTFLFICFYLEQAFATCFVVDMFIFLAV